MFCILLVPIVGNAQSAPYADTSAMEEYQEDEDSVYAAVDETPDSVIFRSTPDSAITRLQGMKEFVYANDPAYWKKEKEVSPKRSSWALFFLSVAFRYLLFAVFIIALIYLLFKVLTENKIILFKRKKKWSANSNEEEVEEQADLTNLISDAEQNGDFRLAARYRYVQLLQEMDSRQLIRMHADRTNWDYVSQLGAHPLNAKFKYLTYAYEYVWYGEFQLNSDQYAQLKTKFETFLH